MSRKLLAAVLALAIAHAPCAAQAQVATESSPDFRAKAPPAGPAVPLVFPPIRETRLSNGVRVLVIEQHALPIVSIHVASNLGGSQTAPGIAGLALLAAMRNSDRIDRHELFTGFSSIGAEAMGSASLDTLDISVKCMTPAVDRASELLAAIALSASFDDDDVEKTRGLRLRDEREAQRHSVPLAVAQALYPASHPFHALAWGAAETIAKATSRDLRAYWRAAFVPERMTIAVVGDVQLETLVPQLEHHFGDAKRSAQPLAPLTAIAPPASGRRTSITLIDKPGESQAKIAVAAIGPAAGSSEDYAMRFAEDLLSTRLRRALRETHGFTYGVAAHFDANRSSGELLVDGAVETLHTADALTLVLAELDRLSTEDIAPDVMTNVKNHRTYGIPSLFGNVDQTAASLANLSVRALPLDTWSKTPARIEAVTTGQVRALAARYLEVDTMTIVIAGDAAAIAPQLAALKLGAVRIVR